MSRNSRTGYAWIENQLIGIKNPEQELSEALAARKGRCGAEVHTTVAELNLWVDLLDRVLDNSTSAMDWSCAERQLRPRSIGGGRIADAQ